MLSPQSLTSEIHLWQHGKTYVFLFSGKAGTGKTFSANMLQDILITEGMNYTEIDSFAGQVKQVAKDGFGWDGIKNDKGRQLLQSVGNVGRQYNPTIWSDYLYNKHFSGFPLDVLIIDDWRFPNEFSVFDESGMVETVTIRLEAKSRELLTGTPWSNDVSEVSLDDFKFDYVVDNEGTPDELRSRLEEIVQEVLTE